MRTIVEHSDGGREAVLRLQGELDLEGHDTLRDTVDEFLEADLERLVVDLSEVPFVDSVGVLLLMGVEMSARQKQRRVVIRGARPRVRKVFRMVGLAWAVEEDPQPGGP